MLCTNCSTEVKPIVAVDIDGTLGDYHGHFIQFAGVYFGMPEAPMFWINRTQYAGDLPFKRWWMDTFEMSEKDWHEVKLAYRQGGMKRSMPIFDGAARLCDTIRNGYGAELWVTTTRPYLSLDNIVPDTVEWLRRHKIEYDGMLFDEDKYEQLANRVDKARVIAVLDDLPEMCAAASATFGQDIPVLVRGLYNRAASYDPFKLSSWELKDCNHLIGNRVQRWHSWTEEMSARA